MKMENSKIFPKIDKIKKAMSRNAMSSAREIFNRANELGINAAVENIPRLYYGLPSQFEEFSKIRGANFCLDVGHVARIQSMETGEDCSWENWFRIVGDKLLIAHLNNCVREDGKVKDHRVLGIGYLDFEDIGKRVKKTDAKYCNLECFMGKEEEATVDELRQSLEIAKKWF